jgi:formate dehydrogenase major subunit
MAVVNITVNGQKIQAQAGQTVIQAAQAAGVDIPALCHHPALPPEGACRVCVVEIEKQRGLQPACTFPVSEGMVVSTESERVVAARKFVLELLFSERIHYCMYCPVSGSETGSQCELQRLAYRYGLTSWQFPPNYAKRWPVDASRKYFVMDHSRCILCRRCIRACDQIVANHTLGVRERGAKTMIIADDDVPFGESTCVSCGTCLQVCPTGALIDRRSAYMGFRGDYQRTKTTCMACPVGCGIEAATRGDMLVRVEGDWDAANGGLLCVHGRFEVVEPQPQRVTAPMVRRDGGWTDVSWEEAATMVASRLRAAGPVAGLASPRATMEELSMFRALFSGSLASDQVGLLYGEMPPTLGQTATLADLQGADLIIVVNGRPLEDQKVVGYVTRRAVEAGAKLVVISDAPTALEAYARRILPLAEIGQIAADVEECVGQPVVLYTAGLSTEAYDVLRNLPDKTRFMPLYRGTNTAGATQIGLTQRQVRGNALFVFAADDVSEGHDLPEAGFTVVQAAYRTKWTDAADVILPALVWPEKHGHIVNIEGRELPVVACVQPPAGVPADAVTLATLAEHIGR